MPEEIQRPKVGDPIWIFDDNHRVYQKGKLGPVWREKWRKRLIIGETSRSWLVGCSMNSPYPTKISKKGPHHGVAFSESEIDEAAYIEENRYRISEAVRYVRDANVLRKVAELIGYKEPTK